MLAFKALIRVFLALAFSQTVLSVCSRDSDCAHGQVCTSLEDPNVCVECQYDSDCAAPLSACTSSVSTTPNVCVECEYDWDCSGGEQPAICTDDNTCQTVECAEDTDCEDGKVCASGWLRTNPNTCVGCESSFDCDDEDHVCTEAGECRDPSTVTVRCLSTQVSITGGMCAGQHTLRLCGESQKQVDDNGASIAEEMAEVSESLCLEDAEEECKMIGGSPKSEETCPSSCTDLLDAEEVNCQGDETCEMSEYGDASTRLCCSTLDEVKQGAKRHCSNIDNERLDALASLALAFMSGQCYDDNCVKTSSAAPARSLGLESLAGLAALSVLVSAASAVWHS